MLNEPNFFSFNEFGCILAANYKKATHWFVLGKMAESCGALEEDIINAVRPIPLYRDASND